MKTIVYSDLDDEYNLIDFCQTRITASGVSGLSECNPLVVEFRKLVPFYIYDYELFICIAPKEKFPNTSFKEFFANMIRVDYFRHPFKVNNGKFSFNHPPKSLFHDDEMLNAFNSIFKDSLTPAKLLWNCICFGDIAYYSGHPVPYNRRKPKSETLISTIEPDLSIQSFESFRTKVLDDSAKFSAEKNVPIEKINSTLIPGLEILREILEQNPTFADAIIPEAHNPVLNQAVLITNQTHRYYACETENNYLYFFGFT